MTVLILTKNEEANLPYALRSVGGWSQRIIVIDSGSSDRTTEIAREFGCEVVFHSFSDYSSQRQFALTLVPADQWVLFLDADEAMTSALRNEITSVLASEPQVNGFEIKRRFLWQGRWIRRGYYPVWITRLVRSGHVRCDDRGVNEHLIVTGSVGRLHEDFIHDDRKGLAAWIEKHNRYSDLEADILISQCKAPTRKEGSFFGSQADRKKWIRTRVWHRIPPLIRPFLYFFYRYIARAGILDGVPGFTYHFLQALWYPLIIDVKVLEKTMSKKAKE